MLRFMLECECHRSAPFLKALTLRIHMRVVVVMAARVPMGMDFCASFKSPERLEPAIMPARKRRHSDWKWDDINIILPVTEGKKIPMRTKKLVVRVATTWGGTPLWSGRTSPLSRYRMGVFSAHTKRSHNYIRKTSKCGPVKRLHHN